MLGPNLMMKNLLKRLVRMLVLFGFVIATLAFSYHLWSPGRTFSDGRYDRQSNGIWLQHGWLADDRWFEENQKQTEQFRPPGRIAALSSTLKKHGIRYVFPHLCPCSPAGLVPSVDDQQTERFLNESSDVKVLPWIGGVLGRHCFPHRPEWRKAFVASIVTLIARHQRLAGVQINIEPLPTGNQDFLTLLDDIRQALPPEKILSVAAYPPPTSWHPFPDVHWDREYYAAVSKRTDLLVPMMYDTSLFLAKPYIHLMSDWTAEILAWSSGTQILLGIPAYEDADREYHYPGVENLGNALAGIHAGLSNVGSQTGYLGTAIYCEWEMNEDKWATLQREFNKPYRSP